MSDTLRSPGDEPDTGGADQVKTTDAYVLTLRYNKRSQRHEIRIASRGAGRHIADHATFTLLDPQGRAIEQRPITPEVADFIFRHFEQRGDTDSFFIYEEDLRTGTFRPRIGGGNTPLDVRHRLTVTEKSFTATGSKLAAHWPVFTKLRETGYGSLIRATMTNHQVCSSHCQYCSTISRNKKDSVSLEEAKDFVRALYFDQAAFNRERFPEYNAAYKALTGSDIRLRGLILSGGGQPNLWPHFAEFVTWLSELDIDLGLITNGFPKRVPEEIYRHFKWVRLSITPEDASPFYPDKKFERQYIPDILRFNKDITVGFSYVYGPWTDDAILARIDEAVEANGFRYCRILADCNLPRTSQLRLHKEIGEKLHDLGLVDSNGHPLRKIFHQLKYHGTRDEAQDLWDEGQCYLQAYNVFWDTTGHEEMGHSFCYPCDSVTVLAEMNEDGSTKMSERKFDHTTWGTVPNTAVDKLFKDPVAPYFDPRDTCSSCLFMRNNQAVKELRDQTDFTGLTIPDDLEHRNFP